VRLVCVSARIEYALLIKLFVCVRVNVQVLA